MLALLVDLIRIVAQAFTLLIIARVFLSWVNPDPHNPIVIWIHRLTEPALSRVRSLLPTIGGFDFSPIVVLFGVQIGEQLLVRFLYSLTI